jgi:chorismate mutase-like protein
MTEGDNPLAALRRDIDRIDDQIHDLLMRRTQAVVAIRDLKRASGEPVLRPAREAAVLRRLIGRHRGPFPKTALVRVWREIMAGQVRVQAPFSIAVLAQAAGGALWDLARDHFGAATPTRRYETARSVLRAVADGEATVGVLPMPGEDDADPWWPALAGNERDTPRIIARLPFASPADRTGAQALAIGLIEQEKSGADHSYVIVEAKGGASRRTLSDIMAANGLEPIFLVRRAAPAADGQLFLAEIGSFVERDDARLERLAAADAPAIRRAVAVGGYALPLGAAELEDRR